MLSVVKQSGNAFLALTPLDEGSTKRNNLEVGLLNKAGNTKGGSITVLLTSCLTGLESAVWQLTIFVFIC
jgi:hypothetical protein